MPGWPRSNRCSSRASLAAGAELFSTRVRSSGYSIGYNTSVAIFGGTAPYVATWLVARTGSNLAPALYVVAAAVVTLLTVLTMRETARQPLRMTGDAPDRPLSAREPPGLLGADERLAALARDSADPRPHQPARIVLLPNSVESATDSVRDTVPSGVPSST